jgi:hypothetical protein
MKALLSAVTILVMLFTTLPQSHAQVPTQKPQQVMSVQSAAEQLFFVTVRIESEKIDRNGNQIMDVSTGFIVTYEWAPGKRGDFLLASKHAIKDAISGRFFFTRAVGGQPALGETYNIVVEDFEKRWFVPEDPKIDVAIMPLAWILREFNTRGWQVYYRSISEEMSLGSRKGQGLDAIEEVIFMGYPSGIFDTKNFIPVARRGVTATPLNVDYGGLPQFLIDASVFPGSSGSPVFIVNTGSYSDRTGRLKIGNRVIFLGMISSLVMRREVTHFEFEGEGETLPFLSTNQMVNIGVVYKASVIFDLVRQLLVASGEIKS